jgi:hypothetical protein
MLELIQCNGHFAYGIKSFVNDLFPGTLLSETFVKKRLLRAWLLQLEVDESDKDRV